MIGIEHLNLGIKLCKQLIPLINIQEKARKTLVRDLTKVCSNCEDAFSKVLKSLLAVKKAYKNPKKLPKELRLLAADDTTRKAFKPEGLCTEVTQLLADMRDNLNALKYAVHIFSIQEINQLLLLMRNLDFDLKREYEEFMNELGSIADKLEETENKNIQEHDFLVSVAKSRINGFQNDLRKSINKMRKAKQSIISIM